MDAALQLFELWPVWAGIGLGMLLGAIAVLGALGAALAVALFFKHWDR